MFESPQIKSEPKLNPVCSTECLVSHASFTESSKLELSKKLKEYGFLVISNDFLSFLYLNSLI